MKNESGVKEREKRERVMVWWWMEDEKWKSQRWKHFSTVGDAFSMRESERKGEAERKVKMQQKNNRNSKDLRI